MRLFLAVLFAVSALGAARAGEPANAELDQSVRNIAEHFMSDMDEGRFEYAYGWLTEAYKAQVSFTDFTLALAKFNALAGPVISRRITKVTWPTGQPKPGTYAVLDVVSRFGNIERHCGVITLYRAPDGSAFRVMHAESVYLDNQTAADIAKKGSPAALEKTWADRSRACPNYTP